MGNWDHTIIIRRPGKGGNYFVLTANARELQNYTAEIVGEPYAPTLIALNQAQTEAERLNALDGFVGNAKTDIYRSEAKTRELLAQWEADAESDPDNNIALVHARDLREELARYEAYRQEATHA